MKRILHISKYYYPFVGGVEQTARDCVNALEGKFEQKVVCFNHNKGDKTDIVDGIEVVRCGCQFKISSQSISISYSRTLKYIIKNYNPDYIVFHYPNPFVAYFLLNYMNKECKLLMYWHLDITKQKFLSLFVKSQNKKLLDNAWKIIATSPNYIEGSPWLYAYRNKCNIIPSCINEDRLNITDSVKNEVQRIKERNNNKIICLAVGRHVEYKGFEYLISSSKLLNDDFIFYIAGSGPLTKKLKKLAGGDKKINFLGKIEDAKLKAYLNATDIFCFPSITKNEAYGLALAEAMYYGKPTITFEINGSGVNFVSINGVTGLEVENCSVKKLAGALTTLAQDSKLRLAYGNNARIRAETMFLFSQYKKNILKLFE